MNEKLLKEFEAPGSDYRGAPFWAWNGKLEPEELRRQVRLMHRMGLGGFFMHSRVGLDTPYLSDEWFECVAACVDEAEKLDMKAWLYDEDRWPSGAAGGLVTKNPKYRIQQLVLNQYKKPGGFRWSKDILAAFSAKIHGTTATAVRRLAKGKRPAGLSQGEKILAFRVKVQDCSSWYNNYTYLDTMNHEAVREFINVTHESYRKNVGKHFGKRIPGIFTDEPNYGWHGPERGDKLEIPWTQKLPGVFRKRYGYDILNHLVELYYNVDGKKVTPARWHYYDCITFLFTDAFARQIGEWCQKNRMQHTGHVLAEETLASQTSVVGSCMRFYEYMQAPGIDLLTEYSREYDTAKQASSAARQFGRRWRLTETYGCTGWDFNFAGHKALGDWQAALGINLRCQHLSWYTMEGEAKRDYPAGIFYQSPWWRLYSRVEDYFARIHVLMSRGREVRDLLVIHPVESMWLMFYCNGGKNRQKLEDGFWRLRDTLLAGNIDFDYGDEDILARHAKVKKKNGQALLAVCKAEYRVIVVPPVVTMRRSTLDLLRKFRRAGGTVVFAGKVPEYVDAMPSADAASFAASCVKTPSNGNRLVKAVESARRVSIADGAGREIRPALYCLRKDRDAYYLFVCNTSQNNFGKNWDDPAVRDRKTAFPEVNINVFADLAGQPLEFDPDTGAIFGAEGNLLRSASYARPSQPERLLRRSRQGQETREGWEIHTSLPVIGSRLFVLPRKKAARRLPKRKVMKDVRSQALSPAKWDIRLSEPNCLVLDRPSYRIGNGKWKGSEEILRVDDKVRETLGIACRGGQMVQPWARTKNPKPRRVKVALRYIFGVSALPSGDLHLALEQPHRFSVCLNGVMVSTDAECGWWCDRSLRKLPLSPALLRIGSNEIVLECDYDESYTGLEIIYLLGNFGTHVKGVDVAVTETPRTLKTGDWVKQGLAFYGGSVSYVRMIRPKLKKGERLFVRVPDYRGTAVRVLVNGREAGIIAWPPNEVDITALLDGAGAALAVEVIGHRRNSHGPHHLTEKWPRATGPGSYRAGPGMWFEGYQLVPCGLMKPPELVWKR